MLWDLLRERRRERAAVLASAWKAWRLRFILWALWTLMVVGVGLIQWHADVIAQRPLNTLGLVIHCAVAGLIGLVVMTVIEMHLEPWRFVDTEE